jgi:hypothetical protein
MPPLRPALATAIFIAILSACDDSLAPADLAGAYDVLAFEFTNAQDTTQKVDLVGQWDTVTATITVDGAFTVYFDGTPEHEMIAIDGNAVTITWGGETATGTIHLSGATVTMTLDTGVHWVFGESGPEEPAVLRIVMTRQG